MEIKQHRQLEGVVVGDKMAKTVVVAVTQIKMHPKYLKQYKVTKKFKAHDENKEFHVGDKIYIDASPPDPRAQRQN